MTTISTLSSPFIRSRIRAYQAAGLTDPTGFAVEACFKQADSTDGNKSQDPAPADWKTAAWDSAGGIFFVKIQVGPGTPVGALAPGKWFMWVKITAPPETPTMNAGPIIVT